MRGANTMAEGDGAAKGSTSTTSASTSELGVYLLNGFAKTFSQFFQLLFVIMGLAAMNTSKANSLLMMASVFTVVLYYLSLVLVTMLILQQLHTRSFLLIIVILLLGSVVSILALMMISPTIVWIALAFWIFIFALVGYYNRQKLYQLIPERIKNLIEGHGGGMSIHNSEFPITESEIGDTQDP